MGAQLPWLGVLMLGLVLYLGSLEAIRRTIRNVRLGEGGRAPVAESDRLGGLRALPSSPSARSVAENGVTETASTAGLTAAMRGEGQGARVPFPALEAPDPVPVRGARPANVIDFPLNIVGLAAVQNETVREGAAEIRRDGKVVAWIKVPPGGSRAVADDVLDTILGKYEQALREVDRGLDRLEQSIDNYGKEPA